VKYAVEQRLRMIDFLLHHYGYIGRPQMVDFFGISTPTVSADFALYLELFPSNTRYDLSDKRYVRLPTFKRGYP
jgi:hypothetical protein